MFRFFSFLLAVVLVVIIAVAFFRGWVDVSVFKNQDTDETGATVTIHRAKVKEDMANLKNEVRDLKPGDKEGETRVHGTVKTVAPEAVTLATNNPDRPLTVTIARETSIQIGQKQGTLDDIHPGDGVTVDYVTRDDRRVAKSVHKD